VSQNPKNALFRQSIVTQKAKSQQTESKKNKVYNKIVKILKIYSNFFDYVL